MKQFLQSLSAMLCFSLSLILPACAAIEDTGFTDVAADAWYTDAVLYVREEGLMGGTSEHTFSPDAATSRATLVTVLHRIAGCPGATSNSFSDVDADAWYANAANWAYEIGLIGGYGDGRFGPSDPITREQMATILWRYEGSPEAGSPSNFSDQFDISDYARIAVNWAQEKGIFTGRDGNLFLPQESCTRAETATILQRYLSWRENSPSEPSDLPKLRITVGSHSFLATLEDNPTTQALLAQLPLTVTMEELNGNEKYYYLPDTLPSDPSRPGSIHEGDLMLYGSNCLVLFYQNFESSYSYTRLGRIDDPAGLADRLGSGDVTVHFEIE